MPQLYTSCSKIVDEKKRNDHILRVRKSHTKKNIWNRITHDFFFKKKEQHRQPLTETVRMLELHYCSSNFFLASVQIFNAHIPKQIRYNKSCVIVNAKCLRYLLLILHPFWKEILLIILRKISGFPSLSFFQFENKKNFVREFHLN